MPADALTAFHWTPQPDAEKLVAAILRAFIARCSAATELEMQMRDQTGTRLADWVDSIHVPASAFPRENAAAAGFKADSTGRVWVHAGGVFPSLVIANAPATKVWLKVESAADFLAAWAIAHPAAPSPMINGHPGSRLRTACVARQEQAQLWIVERHGCRSFALPDDKPARILAAAECWESFARRRRAFGDDSQGFSELHRLIDSALGRLDMDVDWTADLFFASERAYWQRRNQAAQIQKHRQDRLGLGWANHDHHTYRSSRQQFAALIGVFEKLGCQCRERFYAGSEAGWGAQVLEQPRAGIVIFADVDLSPDELAGDFAHDGLSDRRQLGTVGLWCALHGQAILQAGMHHLECQFDFDSLKKQLEREGLKVMKPFTDLQYLKQAFTEGEIWPVDPLRVQRLLDAGTITAPQAAQFLDQGALGSHLENLQRDQGFKGFNQQGVSDIIARTDPRRSGA